MASTFTYEIKKLGPKSSISVYKNNSLIYTGPPSFSASEEVLVREAKANLENKYGNDVNNMVRIPSSINNPSVPNSEEAKKQIQSDTKNKADEIKQQQESKVEAVKQSFVNPKDLIKTSVKNSKKIIISILTPVLLNFLRKENILKANIDKLKKQLKKQLAGKGSLTIVGNTFVFTPNNYSDYTIIKQDFDKKVNNIKKLVNTLNQILTQLKNVLKFLNIALSVLQVYILVKTKILLVKKTSVITDLASPSPSKTSAPILIDILKQEANLKNTQDKISDYQLIIVAVKQFINLFSSKLSKIKLELNQLQLDITSSNVNTSMTLDSLIGTAPESEEYVDSFGKSYTLNFVSYPDGSKQYQALDSFSKLKITQTALSKFATEEQLLEEIKQILG